MWKLIWVLSLSGDEINAMPTQKIPPLRSNSVEVVRKLSAGSAGQEQKSCNAVDFFPDFLNTEMNLKERSRYPAKIFDIQRL